MSFTKNQSRGRAKDSVEFWVCGTKPRRNASRNVEFPKRIYRLRGAPKGAMSRSEFARFVGKDRTTIWRWEQREWLRPARSIATRPFYAREQIDECETIKLVRSAPVMRAIRELLKRSCRHA